MTSLLDAHMEKLGMALARRTPSTGRLARITSLLTGTAAPLGLPVDRRHRTRPGGPQAKTGRSRRGGGAQERVPTEQRAGRPEKPIGRAAPICNCTDSQYCYMHGHPCKCCNGTDSSCPPGTTAGSYWAYCCSHRMIYFRDCCGGTPCPPGTPWCSNSSQPNWCGGVGGNVYRCTLAEDHGPC